MPSLDTEIAKVLSEVEALPANVLGETETVALEVKGRMVGDGYYSESPQFKDKVIRDVINYYNSARVAFWYGDADHRLYELIHDAMARDYKEIELPGQDLIKDITIYNNKIRKERLMRKTDA